MQIGIIGLPNVGKSTLFNALTCLSVAAENFPFTTIEPNVGIVEIPDARLNKLGEIFKPKKLTSATIRFVDIAGLVKGASKGDGLGNKFLAHIREMDALVQVLRDFSSTEVASVLSHSNPELEKEVIETELIFSDLDHIKIYKEKLSGAVKSGDEEANKEYALLCDIEVKLNQGIPVHKQGIVDDIKSYNFLTSKPLLYVLNVDENRYNSSAGISDYIMISAKLEAEITCFSYQEQEALRKEAGIKESGLNRLISEGKKLLDLVTFYTVVGAEVRAWNIKRGGSVLQGAGKIHTDMEKGFIRADIYNFEDLNKYGNEKELREKGLIRSEGRGYIINDGDVIRIHFR